LQVPASQRQVRGYGEGVRLVILDEAGFMPPEVGLAAAYSAGEAAAAEEELRGGDRQEQRIAAKRATEGRGNK
jgi:hypothetical protein